MSRNFHVPLTTALAEVPTAEGAFFKTFLMHGSMSLELYRPQKIDRQKPHRQDEIYVVASGSGHFWLEGETVEFASGDFLFVPAHRFEDFSDDFAAWVIFYGPDSGEAAAVR